MRWMAAAHVRSVVPQALVLCFAVFLGSFYQGLSPCPSVTNTGVSRELSIRESYTTTGTAHTRPRRIPSRFISYLFVCLLFARRSGLGAAAKLRARFRIFMHTEFLSKSVWLQSVKLTLLSDSEVQKFADRRGARCRRRAPPLRAGRRVSGVGRAHERHGDVAPGAAAQAQTGHASNLRSPPTFGSEQQHEHTKRPPDWAAHTQVSKLIHLFGKYVKNVRRFFSFPLQTTTLSPFLQVGGVAVQRRSKSGGAGEDGERAFVRTSLELTSTLKPGGDTHPFSVFIDPPLSVLPLSVFFCFDSFLLGFFVGKKNEKSKKEIFHHLYK